MSRKAVHTLGFCSSSTNNKSTETCALFRLVLLSGIIWFLRRKARTNFFGRDNKTSLNSCKIKQRQLRKNPLCYEELFQPSSFLSFFPTLYVQGYSVIHLCLWAVPRQSASTVIKTMKLKLNQGHDCWVISKPPLRVILTRRIFPMAISIDSTRFMGSETHFNAGVKRWCKKSVHILKWKL